MSRSSGPSSVLGSVALLRLCNRVPIHCFSWAFESAPWQELIERQGKLRARIWRTHCGLLRTGQKSCADGELACRSPDDCRADRWLPLPSGSGAESWRMATLFVRAYPRSGRLVAWVLGELDESVRSSVVGLFRPWLGKCAPEYRVGRLVDFSPAAPGWYRVDLVTPWVLEKTDPRRRMPGLDDFAVRFYASLERRMQKFASLAIAHCGSALPVEASQLVGFSARYIAAQLLPEAARIGPGSLGLSAFGVPSGSNRKLVPHVMADAGGHFVVELAPEALPWLGLLTLAGGGKSADKGFGGIELSAC